LFFQVTKEIEKTALFFFDKGALFRRGQWWLKSNRCFAIACCFFGSFLVNTRNELGGG